MIFNVQNIWGVAIGILVAGILSIGVWIFSEVRDMPVKYETALNHRIDIEKTNGRVDRLEKKIVEQQTRIEEKVDETNRFLRDYLSTHN